MQCPWRSSRHTTDGPTQPHTRVPGRISSYSTAYQPAAYLSCLPLRIYSTTPQCGECTAQRACTYVYISSHLSAMGVRLPAIPTNTNISYSNYTIAPGHTALIHTTTITPHRDRCMAASQHHFLTCAASQQVQSKHVCACVRETGIGKVAYPCFPLSPQ